MDSASTPAVYVRYKTGYSVTQIVIGGLFLGRAAASRGSREAPRTGS